MGRSSKIQESSDKPTTAALGLRAHSGWAALIIVSSPAFGRQSKQPSEGGTQNCLEVLCRKRIELVDSTIPGSKQPYHAAEGMPLKEAEKHLARCAEKATLLARQAFGSVIDEMREKGIEIVGCGYLLSSARPLPSLAGILASHPLIHTAEGEFFRNVIVSASEHYRLPITRIKERDAYEIVSAKFGITVEKLQRSINELGRTLGSAMASG